MGISDSIFALSPGVSGELEMRDGFHDFLVCSMAKYLAGDWGEISEEEKEHNRKHPETAISAYTFDGEIKIYAKRENGRINVFLPEEA